MALLPGEERGLTLSPETAALRGPDRSQQLSRRLRALTGLQRRRASLGMLHGVRRWLILELGRR